MPEVIIDGGPGEAPVVVVIECGFVEMLAWREGVREGGVLKEKPSSRP